jgi:hypothetical protein
MDGYLNARGWDPSWRGFYEKSLIFNFRAYSLQSNFKGVFNRMTVGGISRQTLMGDQAAWWYLKRIDSFVHP